MYHYKLSQANQNNVVKEAVKPASAPPNKKFLHNDGSVTEKRDVDKFIESSDEADSKASKEIDEDGFWVVNLLIYLKLTRRHRRL